MSPLFSLQATCQRLRSGQFQATAAGAVTGAAAVGASGGATGLAGGAAIGTAVGSLGTSSDVGCLSHLPLLETNRNLPPEAKALLIR